MTQAPPPGTLYGIGLGPGDPELLTLKAHRLITCTHHLAYFAKAGRQGHARTIIAPYIGAHHHEIPLFYPLTTEVHFDAPEYKAQLAAFYAQAAEQLAAILASGQDVALACEGDPLFYGSFMHLYIRLRDDFPTQIVPGITGMSGCWSAGGVPMTWGDDVLTVLPGTLHANALKAALAATDAAVIMKIGRNFRKIRETLDEVGLLSRALYIERGTMVSEKIQPLASKTDDSAPYFSIILVPGQGRRP